MGRKPAAKGPAGEPEKTSDWPKLSVSVRESTRLLLQEAAHVSGVPMWKLVETAVLAHLPNALSKDDYRRAKAEAQRKALLKVNTT